MQRPEVYGWDIGGAHVKACRLQGGVVVDAVEWACPLWQGEAHLARVLEAARNRWPGWREARHAVTMTGEMVDLFEHREAGVQRIAELLDQGLDAAAPLQLYAAEAGWCAPEQVAPHWEAIASANWLATAHHAAAALAPAAGVLVDIGSTTTDLIAFGDGRVLNTGRSDAERLASGELAYQGVVRTPLCALGPRIAWRGRLLNVMNEFFATTADVYRLSGELDPAHDLHPAADNGTKDAAGSRRRLARMIGLDAREATADEWQLFARAWRVRQTEELRGQFERVVTERGLGAGATVVAAGCGDFLVPELLAPTALTRCVGYASAVARLAPDGGALARWTQVCAPAVAVASLLDSEQA
ncbi:H4MPT-linked C1 transfer pathway protein [Rubrivivax sp. A210]|uniref:hydantoinase/oxoprolinase family protein n=1 Tax=Rubrivivax sp. A210 TaxID=2772301 RepID=UPI00191823C0|nr:hydantoinase/oxoprolinase family protein [Rubrivivax sp. A210]CAD5372160.1 H4MPT-linked C1 transfer pathway protein [Rubrivivax sp. A210]